MTPRTTYLMRLAGSDVADFCDRIWANAADAAPRAREPSPVSRSWPDGLRPLSQEGKD